MTLIAGASNSLVEVALFLPLKGAYTYRVSPAMGAAVQRGSRVLVPLGRRQLVGLVTRIGGDLSTLDPRKLKSVTEILDTSPVINEDLLDFLMWVARYYLAPPGEVLRAALPLSLQLKQRQVWRLTEEGRRVLGAQRAILRSQDEDLAPSEVAILELFDARGGTLSMNQLQAKGHRSAALSRLDQRSLVSQSYCGRGPSKIRTDLRLEVVEPADPDALRRAPRQAALFELLKSADGPVRLGDLIGRPPDARGLVHKLADKGLVKVEEIEVPHDPFAAEPVEPDQHLVLTTEQREALTTLLGAVSQGGFSPFLLHGVTSSGKTEVYLQLIAEVLAAGRSALVLVPEISLTPQLSARFRSRFGDQVAVLHSGLTDAERLWQWRLIRSSQVRIVVGARSALFAPLTDLGVVIVDEEHDPSFKQQEGVHYNARDLALVRAQRAGIVAVLGSATPALESYHAVQQGRLALLEMRHRATPKPLPRVQTIDLRRYSSGPAGILSAPLAEAIQETLARGEQTILFLNRRGFSSFILCKSCGEVVLCKNCSVSMTYHRSRARIVCHYCGATAQVPRECPSCAEDTIDLRGLGTEQVEQYLQERFSGARVARLDRDTAAGRGLKTILERVRRREVDILVGTQMVTKGHDFPHVTLVGVICADLGLNFPDFRAAERTFQLLTQVAGRAGRGDQPGHVIIQTYNPDHPSLIAASAHDYRAFYEQEIKSRQDLSYPPCAFLAAVRFDGVDSLAVASSARAMARHVDKKTKEIPGVYLLGPAEAPIQRLKGKTRWLLLIKGTSRSTLRRMLETLAGVEKEIAGSKVRITVDVDPLFML